MPLRNKVPRTTHQWLKNLYDYLDNGVLVAYPSGASGIPNAAWLGKTVPQTQIGNATGVVGFFGATGVAPIATGGNVSLGATYLGVSGNAATGIGNSGLYYQLGAAAYVGGTGTPYTVNDIVIQLKNLGLLPR